MTRATRLPTALAAVVALTACTPQSDPAARARAENEIAVRSLLGVWGSGDAEALAGLFRPDAVYDDFPNSVQYRGLEEIAGYLRHVHDWAGAVAVDVGSVQASRTGAVAEWVFSGVQDRPIGDRVPVATGREVVLNGVTIIEMEDGRIRRAADYIDVLPLVLQLGGEVHLPGGGLITLGLPPG